MKQKAVFLDIDGTVRRGIQRPELGRPLVAYAPWWINELTFEPYLGLAVKKFRTSGYLIIGITNQPDVGYGHLPKSRWEKIHRVTMDELKPDACYWCAHGRNKGCNFKKPKPGMIFRAARDFSVNLKKSFMIGDTENDTLAGKAAGCKTVLIRRSYNLRNEAANKNADYIVKGLLEVAAIV